MKIIKPGINKQDPQAVAAQARVADAQREVAAARSAEIKAKASAQEAPLDGVKLAEEGVVVAPAEDPAVAAAAGTGTVDDVLPPRPS